MTNPISDIEKSDLILVTGSNTTEGHPVISSYIKRAVEFGKAKLIVIDPRKIPLTKFATRWISPNPGTNVAWLNGMMHIIIKENLYDRKYVESRTEGFYEFKETIEKYTPEYVSKITKVPAEELVEAARMFAAANSASIFYAMGITQYHTGTDNVKSIANLAMLCGNVGIPGGGVNPLRGQNNVQGACDLGALPNVYSGYQPVNDPKVREEMARMWNVPSLPETPGLALTEMIEEAGKKIKSLYIIGENPLISDPDLNHVEKSLASLDFLVVQDIFLTETAKYADVVLPSSSFAEKEGTFTNTERKVQRIHKAVNSPGQARLDWKIVCNLSTRLGFPMTYKNSTAIMEEINRVTPSYRGITYSRLKNKGIHWPCPTTKHPGIPILHVDKFARGLGLFHAIDYIPPAELPDEKFPLYLTTGRILYQFHTGTMTMQSEGLNERSPECLAEISPEDAKIYQVEDGIPLKIISRRGEITAKAKVTGQAPKGTIFIPFHFADAAVNRLTNAARDPIAKIPELKVCAIRIENAD